jgi:endonuclease-8
MPEGQVSHRNAIVLTDAIAGYPLTLVEAPERRLGPQRLAERLHGDVLERMEARGKHHLFRFRSGRVLHSHLQMSGKWRAFPSGADIPRGGLWLALHTDRAIVAQYRGPVMRLYEPAEPLPHIAALGPDLLADDADAEAIGLRLLAIEPTRAVGDAVMDQRVMSGIGNVYKSETLFLAGIDPWRAVGTLTEDDCRSIGRIGADLLAQGVRDGGRITTYRAPMATRGRNATTWVYGRRGRPCRECGTPISSRGQGDANRTTYWCTACQG